MNKKFLIVFLSIFGIALVSALTYYALFSASFTVNPSIIVTGNLEQDLGNVFDGDVINGTPITITNNAPSQREVTLTNDGEEIEVSYVSDLVLSHKDLTTWTLIGDPITIRYTAIGDSFKVWNVPEGYTAVYYPNKVNYAYYDGVVVLSNDVAVIPTEDDLNGGSLSDYCTNTFNPTATQCLGGKLWLIPNSDITSNVIDWSKANEFYFETSLIQFNKEGNIIISSGSSLTITPVYTVAPYVSGNYTITTIVE